MIHARLPYLLRLVAHLEKLRHGIWIVPKRSIEAADVHVLGGNQPGESDTREAPAQVQLEKDWFVWCMQHSCPGVPHQVLSRGTADEEKRNGTLSPRTDGSSWLED